MKTGNKFKLSARQRRHLISCPRVLQERDRDFTCKRLMEEAVIEERNVSVRTCYLNSAGYLYLQARKKGLMTEDDHRLLKTCEKLWNKYLEENNSFLLGRNIHCNPFDQAIVPRA